MKARIRELLHAVPFRPFVIQMTDGREYRIDQPDFVLASPTDYPEVIVEELDGRTHFLAVKRMASAEHSRPPSEAA